MIACNNTSATRTLFIIVAVFITGYLFCAITVFAQQKQDYWLLTVKRNKYKILPQNKIDTITISSNGLKQNVCIAYKTENADRNSNNKLIVIMSSTRQELARLPLKNGKVVFSMALFSTVTDNIVSINVVQQPKLSELGKRARIGTKLICYVKW
jgi:hypothetical protein